MPKAQLFITCLGDQFYTSTLQNMTYILERLGVELVFPPEQTCCGQPLFNNGFEEINRSYLYHCQAAREIAEIYFDSQKVLQELLNQAL